MSFSELLDLDTLVEMKKAAPQVTTVPFDIACWVVRAMNEFSKNNKANIDQNSLLYWQARVKDLHDLGKVDDGISLTQIGRALKAMGLESWRKMDGFHVAWSQAQLDILMKHFKG